MIIPRVTDHAVRRWLERADGWDLSADERSRYAATGAASDGAALEAWARRTGASLAGVRARILTDEVRGAIRAGVRSIRVRGVILVVVEGAIVTCKQVRPRAWRGPRRGKGRPEPRRPRAWALEAAE